VGVSKEKGGFALQFPGSLFEMYKPSGGRSSTNISDGGGQKLWRINEMGIKWN
jgi:hypothetical protein